MAEITNQKYGVASCDGEISVLKKMGVAERNIFNISRCNELLNRMMLGDILCVASVKSFSVSSYDLVNKMLFLSNRGIEFQSGNERYLSFSAIKPLSVVTAQTLKNIAQREYEFVQDIQKSNLNKFDKIKLISKIQYESLTDIVLVFNNNGIRKKGN